MHCYFSKWNQQFQYQKEMFRCTLVALRISMFSAFLKEASTIAALKGLNGPNRGRKAGELYRSLADNQRFALRKKANRLSNRRVPKVRVVKQRVATAFAAFVKANYKTAKGSSMIEKTRYLAGLWKAGKK